MAPQQGKHREPRSGRVRWNPVESGHDWHETGTSSHATSLSARAGALRFWAVRVAAVRDEIEAIAVTDPDLPEPAIT